MRKLLAALLILSTPANAAVAEWSQTKYWTVLGDAQEQWCTASTPYASGFILYIARNRGGWNLAVSGMRVNVGQVYKVPVATKFDTGMLYGMAVGNDQVVFDKISPNTLANLAIAPSILIENRIFALRGSAEAIRSVNECYNAVSGRLL